MTMRESRSIGCIRDDEAAVHRICARRKMHPMIASTKLHPRAAMNRFPFRIVKQAQRSIGVFAD
jgi:hypothetical protein